MHSNVSLDINETTSQELVKEIEVSPQAPSNLPPTDGESVSRAQSRSAQRNQDKYESSNGVYTQQMEI
ncbi:hypothetical protein N7540_010675 [Penicillium herquei]|nr:hypothetical protein N7540_010675 [Penicillium herquei]